MKKTFTINISGILFHIEEDAYEKLQGYLLKLKGHFGNNAEGREIVADIENRISELFTEKAKEEAKVVTAGWVDEVIGTMGTPEDFLEQERTGEPFSAVKRKRRLWRCLQRTGRLFQDRSRRDAHPLCGALVCQWHRFAGLPDPLDCCSGSPDHCPETGDVRGRGNYFEY